MSPGEWALIGLDVAVVAFVAWYVWRAVRAPTSAATYLPDAEAWDLLRDVRLKLDIQSVTLSQLRVEERITNEHRRADMSQITDALARLKDDVTKNRGLVSSIIQQNQGFADQLRQLANKDTTGEITAGELNELADQLEGDGLSMATAITSNTIVGQQTGPAVPLTPPAPPANDTTPSLTVPEQTAADPTPAPSDLASQSDVPNVTSQE